MTYSVINDRISQLKSYAVENGLKIRFRNHTTNQGDFCIFIYKSTSGQYLAGFDGYWDSNVESFNKAYNDTINFIDNYNK